MLTYIECPETYDGELPKLFLAGGISGCINWQKDVVEMLEYRFKKLGLHIVIFNPRRKDFDVNDPAATEVQIEWEHEYMRKADVISFWFPEETLCPITLYELGAWSMTDKRIAVGINPGYKREQDVVVQTSLVRPEVEIVCSLALLTLEIEKIFKSLDK